MQRYRKEKGEVAGEATVNLMKDRKEAAVFALKPYLREAIEIANRCTANIVTSEEDDFAFMAVNFLNKQVDHAESLLMLIPRRDCCLIARSMFDGLCQLLWAFQNPVERGKQWRAFSIVCDWRTMQDRMNEGYKIDEIDRRRIEAGLKVFGKIFEKKSSTSAPPTDPYHKNWRAGVTIADTAAAVGAGLGYKDFYVSVSGWEHWGPDGFGDALARSEDRVTYSCDSLSAAVPSMLFGLESLIRTIEILNLHLKLSKAEPILALRNRCRAELDVIVRPAA